MTQSILIPWTFILPMVFFFEIALLANLLDCYHETRLQTHPSPTCHCNCHHLFKQCYLKNAYSETDPFVGIAAYRYIAAKAEECPVSIKVVASEARALLSPMYHFP